jgi:hypothetical protein
MLTREETIKIYNDIYIGLKERGFGPLNGQESSKGGCCTPDKKHYMLQTDGMFIYSNIPDYSEKRMYEMYPQYYPDGANVLVKEWHFDEFSFEELDDLMGGD